MFFDMDLLCRQRKGKFAIIWIAATRGISHVKRSEIENVNIIYVCEEILKFVMSNSTSPRRRLSLYLSAKLIYGAVLVHRYQVMTLEKSAVHFSVTIRRPTYRCIPALDEDELREKRKRQKKTSDKKQKKAEEAYMTMPEQMRQPLPNVSVNVTDIIHITLPEETSTRPNINEQDLFGDEGQIEQQLAQFDTISMPQFPALEPEPNPVLPIKQEMAAGADKRLIETVEDVEQSPSKRRRSEIRPVSPLVRRQEHGSLSPNEEQRALMPPPPVPRRSLNFSRPGSPRPPRRDSVTRLTDDEMLENILARPIKISPETSPQGPRQPRPNPRSVKRFLSQEFSLFHFSRWQGAEIYQSIELVGKRTKRTLQDTSPDSANHTRLQYDDASNIIEEILGEIREVDDIIPEVRNVEEDTSLEAENRLRKISDHSRTLDASAQNISAPMEATHVINVLSPLQMVPSPRFSKIPIELEIESFRVPQQEPIPEPIPITEEAIGLALQSPIRQPVRTTEEARHTPRVHTSTPIGFNTEAKRHRLLLNYLRDHFTETSGEPLTIPDICEPLNRTNVAITFNALLHLHAQRYVVLTTYRDSLELKKILPGPRI